MTTDVRPDRLVPVLGWSAAVLLVAGVAWPSVFLVVLGAVVGLCALAGAVWLAS